MIPHPAPCAPDAAPPAISELLILPDGRVLAHQLTPEFTALLAELNPGDAQFRPRLASVRATHRTDQSPHSAKP